MDENYEKCIEYSTQAVVSDSWVKTLIFMGFPGVFVPKFQLRTGKNRMFWQPCWHQWHQWLIGFRQVETLTPPIFHEKTIVFLQIFSQSDPLLTVLATLLPDWQVLKLVAHVPEISDILVGYPFLKICRTGMIGYSYVLQQKIDKNFLRHSSLIAFERLFCQLAESQLTWSVASNGRKKRDEQPQNHWEKWCHTHAYIVRCVYIHSAIVLLWSLYIIITIIIITLIIMVISTLYPG